MRRGVREREEDRFLRVVKKERKRGSGERERETERQRGTFEVRGVSSRPPAQPADGGRQIALVKRVAIRPRPEVL